MSPLFNIMDNNNDFEFLFIDMQPEEEGVIPLPPEEVRFIEVKTEQVMDEGLKRFRLYIETTAFQQKPHIDLILIDEKGMEIATASIIEPVQRKNVITMHIKGGQTGEFTLHARLFYPDVCESDKKNITFTIE